MTDLADLMADLEAEEAVVAAALTESCPKLAGVIEPKHFFREKNAWVYEAAMAVWKRGEEPNTVTVAHELAVRGQLEAVGGSTFLLDVLRRVPVAGGDAPVWYAGIVKRLAMSREALQVGHAIQRLILDNPDDVERAIDRGIQLLQGVAGQVVTDDVAGADEVFEAGLFARIDAYLEDPNAITGWTTGISEFDEAIDGFSPGRVYLYGAETSMGKSLFGQDVIRRLAKRGHRCLVFTTEMGRDEFLWRLAFQEAGFDPQAHRQGYSPAEAQSVRDAMLRVAELPITICDRGDLSAAYLRGVVQRIRAKYPELHVLLVDHVDQMSGLAGMNRVAELEGITKGLKNIARDFRVAVLEVSHVSRLNDHNRASKSARMRNSESKAQDADIAWMLEPVKQLADGTWHVMEPDEARLRMATGVHVNVSMFKQRHGRVGNHRLFLSWRTGGRFENA
jgi:replicative DNA helicase